MKLPPTKKNMPTRLAIFENVQNDMKVFAEATLGNTVDNSKRAGFIKYDRNVLRFQAVWDDRESLYGDIQRFEVSTAPGEKGRHAFVEKLVQP